MNYRVFRTINGWSGHPALDAAMKVAAKDLILLSFLVLGVLAALALRRRELGRVLAAGVTLATAFLLGLAAAAVHAERRPFQSQSSAARPSIS